MCSPRRILSFAWSDRLIALLAGQGDDWEVVPRIASDRESPWRLARRLPTNVTVVSRARALGRLERGEYDLVVCHGLPDLEETSCRTTPALFVVSGTPPLAGVLGVEDAMREAWRRSPTVTPTFLTEENQHAWGGGGELVPLGLNVEEYGPYTGDRPEVLVVGPAGTILPEVLDTPLLERATAGLPVRYVDRASGEVGTESDASRPWIVAAFAEHRVLLDTSPAWCRDGHHLCFLEAMASGQPVVTTPRSNCLVEDGTSGFVDADPGILHQRLLELLSNRRLATELGSEARRTVAARFPAARFQKRWRELVDASTRPVVAA